MLGNPAECVSGGGAAALDDAVLWGQPVSRITGRMALTPGHVAFDDVRADVAAAGWWRALAMAYKEKTFEVRAAGDGVPLESLRRWHGAPEDIRDASPSRSRARDRSTSPT